MFCPPEPFFPPKRPEETAFWFLCRRGQRNPPPERRNYPFTRVFLFACPKRNQKCPGDWLRGVQALQSPAPGPPLRRTLPGSRPAHPARAVQSIAPASAPLPLAGILEERRAGWTKKARLVLAAVGAGSSSAGGETPPLRQTFGVLRADYIRPYKNRKNVGATAGAVPTFLVCYGRRGETKFRRKLFCLLFSPKKVS